MNVQYSAMKLKFSIFRFKESEPVLPFGEMADKTIAKILCVGEKYFHQKGTCQPNGTCEMRSPVDTTLRVEGC
ncbi:hypothetical protein C922_00242 [Plasmodium inui San Antonio 1]|uniref:Uncharacterized protein n=1 Tax=Plasmodium inui San Antonio 1 TaxID=1237626 RepID=W7AKM1_9APIC|nr:hypothetical protein C922_00242 [Plasmodium inui San Antonio 1]EUD69379.1 hypothetical protein C922_00242 [Plasmodium inui San Antonio 1]